MNKQERRHLLARRLRDGSYKQIQGQLHTDAGMCCLGVACDVFHKETGIGNWQPRERGGYEFRIDDTPNGRDAWGLPDDVSLWYGFASSDGTYEGGCLIDLNDDDEEPFAVIADVIDAEPEGLVEQA